MSQNKADVTYEKIIYSRMEAQKCLVSEELIVQSKKERIYNKESSKTIVEKLRKNTGIVLDKPMDPAHSTMELRLRSFDNWPKTTTVDPLALAKCGFVYTGISDITKCYHCAVEVNEWVNSMNPWKTHALAFPYCAHVRNCKGDTFICIVFGDAMEESEDYQCNDIELTMHRNSDAIEAVQSVYGYDNTKIRKAVDILVDRKINVFNGEKLVKVVEELENIHLELNNPVVQKKVEINQDVNEILDVSVLEEENETLETSLLCKICFVDRARIIILPCGHMCSCPQCVSALVKCPVCRITVQGTVRALFCTE